MSGQAGRKVLKAFILCITLNKGFKPTCYCSYIAETSLNIDFKVFIVIIQLMPCGWLGIKIELLSLFVDSKAIAFSSSHVDTCIYILLTLLIRIVCFIATQVKSFAQWTSHKSQLDKCVIFCIEDKIYIFLL